MPATVNCWCGLPTTDFGVCTGSEVHDAKAPLRPENDNPRKLYIAGPMSGLPGLNFEAFHRAQQLLKDAGYQVVNPATQGSGRTYSELLKDDLRLLLDCDAVATLPDWEASVGARNEVMVAGVCGMAVNTVGYFLAVAPPNNQNRLV